MISPVVGHVVLGLYALLLAVGGIIGFVRARSKASLVTGLASALAALVALWFSTLRSPLGFPLGFALSITLFVFFGYRYALRAHKFMPSGLLAVVSLIVLAVMIFVMDWSRTP
jgi:uncharacterized membrane protein (UPF0136 family)